MKTTQGLDAILAPMILTLGGVACLVAATLVHLDLGPLGPVWQWLTDHGVEVAAIAASPIIALRISADIERNREAENRKLDVLKTLMATRHAQFADDRIRALNTIDVLFRNDVDVRRARSRLMASLSKTEGLNADRITISKELSDEWNERQWELISAMAAVLDVLLTRDDFVAGYSPRAMNDFTQRQYEAAEFNRTMIMFARKELGLRWNSTALVKLDAKPWTVVGEYKEPPLPPPDNHVGKPLDQSHSIRDEHLPTTEPTSSASPKAS